MEFYKFQGTGNDFVMVDNRSLFFPKNQPLIEKICDRRFGVGADGLILLENLEGYDFKMVYYNSDGNESTMCGNGGRCIVAFAKILGIISNEAKFMAVDGSHFSTVEGDTIHLQMKDVDSILKINTNQYQLNTGSPHFVSLQSDIDNLDIISNAHNIRYSDLYQKEGINVNFVEKITQNHLKVRTYERGVEDETYSCGTGVVASVLSFVSNENADEAIINVSTKGGNLQVSYQKNKSGFTSIFLIGEAKFVFKGEIDWH